MSGTRGGLLVTGFGPFPGVPRNPSAALARRIGTCAAPRLGGMPVRVLILPTTYAAIPATLEPALAEGPAAILMLGVASRARCVRVEMRGRNRTSRLFPDASGRIATHLGLERDGPAARWTRAGAQSLAALRRAGLRAMPSHDAGRYLCNATYFRTLREGCPVLFLHVPLPPRTRRPGTLTRTRRQGVEAAMADAFAEVARRLAVQARARS